MKKLFSPTLSGFNQYLQHQNRSPNTIEKYGYSLKRILAAPDQDSFLLDNKDNANIIAAWRKYLRFMKYVGKINNEDLYDQLEIFQLPEKKGQLQDHTWYPKEQWNNLIDKLSTRTAKMAGYIQLQFGLRIGELTNLTVQDFDFNKRMIHIRIKDGWKPKSNRERSIPMTNRQIRIIKRWINNIPSGFTHDYFLWSKHGGKQVPIRTIQKWYQKIGVKSHDLRRSFAKNIYYKSDKDIYFVSRLLGHSSVSITMRYLELDDEEMQEKYEKAMS